MRTPTEQNPIMTVAGLKIFQHVGAARAEGRDTYPQYRHLVHTEYPRLMRESERTSDRATLIDDWLSDLGRLALMDPDCVSPMVDEFIEDMSGLDFEVYPWLAVLSVRMASLDYGLHVLSTSLLRKLS